MSGILELKAAGQLAAPVATQGAAPAEGGDFGAMLKQSIEAVDSDVNAADELVKGLVAGGHANIHETMIALEKANISFRLMTKVQQKVIDAYRETMRLQL